MIASINTAQKRDWPLPAGACGNALSGNRSGDNGDGRPQEAARLPAVAVDIEHDVAFYLSTEFRLSLTVLGDMAPGGGLLLYLAGIAGPHRVWRREPRKHYITLRILFHIFKVTFCICCCIIPLGQLCNWGPVPRRHHFSGGRFPGQGGGKWRSQTSGIGRLRYYKNGCPSPARPADVSTRSWSLTW